MDFIHFSNNHTIKSYFDLQSWKKYHLMRTEKLICLFKMNDSLSKSFDRPSTIGEGTFSLHKGHVISGPFVFLRLSNVPRHLESWLMDADGGSVWHYGHSSACFRGTGHVVCPSRPHSTPLMWPRPPSQLQGVSGPVRSGGTECQFSPPVNTSQHTLIPTSPKVTLLGLQLASQPNPPHALLSSLFPNPDMELWHGAVANALSSVLGPRAAACAGRFHGAVPAQPHGSSSFTVTVLDRKRSKQTCGGREFLTWWITVISIRRSSAHFDWWRLLLTDPPSDWVTRRTKHDLWPEAQRKSWDMADLSKTTTRRSLRVIPYWATLNVNIFYGGEIFATWKQGFWWAPCPLSTGPEPCQQEWWGWFQSLVSAPFCTLFTSCVTSCFFISEEEHRKAR